MPRLTDDGIIAAKERNMRKRKEIDIDKLFELASIGYNRVQCAQYFGVTIPYLESNLDLLEAWREGWMHFSENIIRNQYEIAINKEHKDQVKMLQYLGKVGLGQREVQQIESESMKGTDISSIIKLLKDDE
jgi:hypothetical protein